MLDLTPAQIDALTIALIAVLLRDFIRWGVLSLLTLTSKTVLLLLERF